VELNRESMGDGLRPGEPELVVHYPALSVRLGVDFVIVCFMSILIGGLTAGSLWLLLLCANQLLVLAGWGWGDLVLIQHETSWLPVAGAGLVLLPMTLLFSWFVALAAVHWLRRARRTWWLRLSSRGFQVNDRIFTARRYEWREIDKFMLVAPSAQLESAVVAPAKTFAEAFRTAAPNCRLSAWAFTARPDIVASSRTSCSAACAAGMGQGLTVSLWAIGTVPSTRRSI
jgi:hypothetical protein